MHCILHARIATLRAAVFLLLLLADFLGSLDFGSDETLACLQFKFAALPCCFAMAAEY